jgi:lipopolysaccharide biosynthesis glycosyltransferase
MTSIYMDGDILVTDDIQEVWDMDLTNWSLAAMSVKSIHSLIPELIGRYTFNSGFLVMNLKRIRETNGVERIKEIATRFKDALTLPDQDILNLAFCDDTLRLPVRWNLTTGALEQGDDNYRSISEEDLCEAIKKPAVIHFTTGSKPWRFKVKIKHPFACLYPYFAHLAKAPFAFQLTLFLKFTLKLNRRFYYSSWVKERLPEIQQTIRRIKKRS